MRLDNEIVNLMYHPLFPEAVIFGSIATVAYWLSYYHPEIIQAGVTHIVPDSLALEADLL